MCIVQKIDREISHILQCIQNNSEEMALNTQIGLANIGNTCFLNVVLQALRLAPPIGELCLAKDLVLREGTRKGEFVRAFQTLIRDLWQANVPVGKQPTMIPRGFIHSLHCVLRETGDNWYRPGQQSDAAEALQYILDSLHDGIYRKVKMDIVGTAGSSAELSQVKAIQSWAEFHGKEYSPIIQNFYGQTQMCVTCTQCGNVSERYEPWLMIKAPIPGADVVGGPAPDLTACINSAFAPESIDDYDCSKCQEKTKANMAGRLSRLPPITIVSLKRFTNAGHKVRGTIKWDLDHFDFSGVSAFDRDPFTDSRSPPIYETFAVIEHHGSTHGGHYRMFARQGDWTLYDDSSVQKVTPDSVITADSYVALMMPKEQCKAMNTRFARNIIEARLALIAAAAAAPAPAVEEGKAAEA